MRRVKTVTVGVHPSLYSKMEELRKVYQSNGIMLSQLQVTDLLSRKIKIPNKIDLIGGKCHARNEKKRRPY